MPSKSKQQQKFFGIVRSIQKGEAPKSKFSKAAQDAADDMKQKDVKKMASTKHKGLPKKIKQETQVRSLIRKMVREIIDEGGPGSGRKPDISQQMSDKEKKKNITDKDKATLSKLHQLMKRANEGNINEIKKIRVQIPQNDRQIVIRLLAKINTKLYDLNPGKGSNFILELDKKIANKVLELLMKKRVRVKGL